MRLSNGFVIDKEKTFGELKFQGGVGGFFTEGGGHRAPNFKKNI